MLKTVLLQFASAGKCLCQHYLARCMAAHKWQLPLCGKWSLLTLAVLQQLASSLGPHTGSGTRIKAPHMMPIYFPGTLHHWAGKNTTENLGLHKER